MGGASQTPLPDRYTAPPLPRPLETMIADAKASLGERLVILGHHYQREDIIRFADVRGDSFKLAQWAASSARPSTSSSAACTSWLRAPTSSRPPQQVILPNLAAGCSMADMAARRRR